MKITAELKEITQEMTTTQELADALNHNFKELKEASEDRGQAMLNSIKRVESKVEKLGTRLGNVETRLGNVESRLGNVEFNLRQIMDHLSGKKLLTEND